MKPTVFFSWQGDLPNKTNRTLIGEALARALESLKLKAGASIDAVIDRDTAGLPGSPEIQTAIFRKIDGAAVALFDVSFIGQTDQRKHPNPNVLGHRPV